MILRRDGERRAVVRSAIIGAVWALGIGAAGLGQPARAVAQQPGPDSAETQPAPPAPKNSDSAPTWGEVSRQSQQKAAPAVTTWNDAVRRTQENGTPTILVVTSNSVARSREIARVLIDSPAVKRLKGQLAIAEMTAEAEPLQVKHLKLTRFPALIVVKKGPGGNLERAATYEGELNSEELVGWLLGMGLISRAAEPDTVASADPSPAPETTDPAVTRTNLGLFHHQDPMPSAQAQAPPVVYSPPVVYTQPPPETREVVEQPTRRVVRRVVPKPREMVVVERPAPRRVVHQYEVVEEEEEAPAPRNLLAKPRATPAPRALRAAPPSEEYEVVEEEVEVAPRRALAPTPAPSPRAMMIAEETPRDLVRDVSVEEQPTMALIRPGPFDRMVGAVGARLARRALPRVEVQVEEQKTYRVARPAPSTSPRMVIMSTPRQVVEAPVCAPSPHSVCQPSGPAPSPQQ